jgi:hypothetical protein
MYFTIKKQMSYYYLEPISSGAGQHLVDAEDVEGVDANADVELVLGRVLHHVLKIKVTIILVKALEVFVYVVSREIIFRKKLE